jgi:hypothetical protein
MRTSKGFRRIAKETDVLAPGVSVPHCVANGGNSSFLGKGARNVENSFDPQAKGSGNNKKEKAG